MIKCVFADLKIEIESKYDKMFSNFFHNHAESFENSDVKIEVTSADCEHEKEIDQIARECQYEHILSRTVVLRKFGEIIPNFNGAILHSASFAVNNQGIAFSAFSGTGKTTHMMKWKEKLGDSFQIVNGDKPFIRFIEGELYIYGNPWAGKEGLKANIKVPLKHICQIVRSETNHTEPMSKQEGINLLLNQIYMPFDPMARIKTMQLINRIADSVTFWKISCNMDDDAAEVSYKAIFG